MGVMFKGNVAKAVGYFQQFLNVEGEHNVGNKLQQIFKLKE